LEAARATLPTPGASDAHHGPEMLKARGEKTTGANLRTYLATPRASDGDRGGRGDVLSQLRGYPSKHAGMPLVHTLTTKANQTAPSMMKWAGARALAAMLQDHGLSGTAALPVTYGWMMGYPPGWLARALRSAVLAGRLQLPSSSKPSATRSSRKFPKP
jgi:hypothetical protein